MPSVVMQRSTGFANLYKNIVNCAVLHQLAKAHVVLAKATVTLKPLVVHAVQHGAAEIVSTYAESVKQFHCEHVHKLFDCIFHTYTIFVCVFEICYWIRFLRWQHPINKRKIFSKKKRNEKCFYCIVIQGIFFSTEPFSVSSWICVSRESDLISQLEYFTHYVQHAFRLSTVHISSWLRNFNFETYSEIKKNWNSISIWRYWSLNFSKCCKAFHANF